MKPTQWSPSFDFFVYSQDSGKSENTKWIRKQPAKRNRGKGKGERIPTVELRDKTETELDKQWGREEWGGWWTG